MVARSSPIPTILRLHQNHLRLEISRCGIHALQFFLGCNGEFASTVSDCFATLGVVPPLSGAAPPRTGPKWETPKVPMKKMITKIGRADMLYRKM